MISNCSKCGAIHILVTDIAPLERSLGATVFSCKMCGHISWVEMKRHAAAAPIIDNANSASPR